MNFEQARRAAEASAMIDLEGLYDGPSADILETRHIETAHCWMFFRKRSIVIPHERALSEFAYVFSKHSNEGRCVPDYWNDKKRLNDYLLSLSNHFASQSRE